MSQPHWPALDVASWAPTKRSLHRYAQMLGKLRLALAPYQPNFVFTSLGLSPRGVTTGPMPDGVRCVQASLDVFSGEMILAASDGAERRIALGAPQTVARVFAEFLGALEELGIAAQLSPVPQETPDTTPLDRDDRPAIFEPRDAQRWLAVLCATNAVFDRWRAHFFGRTSIGLWWCAFDFALGLFNGRHVPAPADRGYLFKYDLDAEMMNAGFYPGDEANPPYFYGYLYPEPTACGAIAMPSPAAWSDAQHEWILPYDAVRTSADPERTLVAFLDGLYDACGAHAGWDRAQFTYVPPPLRRARGG